MLNKTDQQKDHVAPTSKGVDFSKLKRTKGKQEEEVLEAAPVGVSAGAVEKALDLAFNPTREKLREVTIIDKTQARLFPMLDVINMLWGGVIEVASYRENKDTYAAFFKKFGRIKPNEIQLPLDELMYRTAQWQKSQGGANLTKITDIALAETEGHTGEDEGLGNANDAWKPE
jgi:hypothetical protein